MSGIKDIRFPSAMRVTTIHVPSDIDAPAPIWNEEYIETVVPATPTELLEKTTGADIAREFEEMRRAADENLCHDCLIYLRSGMSPAAVLEAVLLRRGNEFGVTKQKIEQAVLMAVELEKKEQ
jgi:hypothetical protein